MTPALRAASVGGGPGSRPVAVGRRSSRSACTMAPDDVVSLALTVGLAAGLTLTLLLRGRSASPSR